jgi:RNA polymerase sigma-70 factor (ECF subfamily)
VNNLKFNALVRLYESEVFSLAWYLLKNRGEAEDMTQEAYIRLWENLARVEFARAKFWLLKVVRNLCLDRLRRHAMERDFTSRADPEQPASGPAEILVAEQRAGQLQEAVAGLEEPFRSLVILRDLHQHSYADVARILELSLDQVKVYLFRARQQLRTRLEDLDI